MVDEIGKKSSTWSLDVESGQNSDDEWGLGINTPKLTKAINVEFNPIVGNSASEVQTAIANVVSKIATHKTYTDANLQRVQNLENISEQFNVYMNANPILGNNGVDGFNPIKGLHYDDGTDGINGTDGSDGTNGINGNDGENGYNGYNGVDGANGYNGANGSHGRHGRNGYDGFDGSPGSKGEPGTNGNNGTHGDPGDIGLPGIDGGVVAQLTVFTRHPFLPPKPIGGSFNFATSILSPPDEWSQNVTPGWDPVYMSVAISSGVGQSGIDSNIVWSSPTLLVSNGDTGSAGKSVFTAIVFNRSPAIPTRPVGGSFDFGSNILIPPNNWYIDMPDGDNPAYGTRFTFSISGDTGSVTAETWGQPFKIAKDGIPGLDGVGVDGISTYLVSVFKRASERPDTPVDGLYNFGTNSSQPPAGWADTIPDGDDPLWVSTSIARTQGVTGIDDNLVWAYPTKLSENGQSGEEGRSVYSATVFDRSSSPKSAPSGGSFNFGTNELVAPAGWFLDVPDGSHPVYATRYVFSVIGDTGSVVAGEWSAPIILSENGAKGEDGNVGPDGISTYFISVFKRGTSTPSKPFGGSYNFGTNTLTAPSGWFDSVPGGSDDIYLSTALASTQGVTGVDSTLTWTTPVKVSEKGATGNTGLRGAGWWRWKTNTSSTSNLSNAQINAYFDSATGLNPVAGDRFIVVSNSDVANAYIRNNANSGWITQAAFVDGDMLVDGTITARALDANSITASKIAANAVTASKISVTNLEAISANLGNIIVENANIGETIQSDTFSAGVRGWRIRKNGSAEFNDVTISRQLVVDSGTYGQTVDIRAGGQDDSEPREGTKIYIKTGISIAAWAGTNKTYLAAISNSGTVRANAQSTTGPAMQQQIRWGFTTQMVPLTQWSGGSFMWIVATPISSRVLSSTLTLNWKVYQVS